MIVYGLRDLCKEQNLSSGNMCNVAKGRSKHHKGWLCEYATNDG